ncbi:hypothetical protein LINGRAHAP2_LOCUS19499 [Linum grandiflorum]
MYIRFTEPIPWRFSCFLFPVTGDLSCDSLSLARLAIPCGLFLCRSVSGWLGSLFLPKWLSFGSRLTN